MKINSKKILFNLVLLVICAVVVSFFPNFFPHTIFTQHVTSLAAASNLTLFEQPMAGEQPVVDSINKAHTEILVEVYLLTDKQILAALAGAEQRGVTVKVMMEEHPPDGGSLNEATNKTLAADHISVAWSNPDLALTHEKAIIIDGQELFVLNQNLTASSFQKNREYDVIDTDPTDISEATQIFTADWQRQTLTLTPSHLVVSPYNSREELEKLLNSSTRSIDIEMEVLTDPEIETQLESEAKTRQIRVILADFSKVAANQDAAKQLAAAGIQVKTIKSPYIHAKLIVIDQSSAYVGSINFTAQSMDKNRELGMLIAQPDVVTQLNSDFASDWQIAK